MVAHNLKMAALLATTMFRRSPLCMSCCD
jgi:hypothetical protein